jgi:hypothetical protein
MGENNATAVFGLGANMFAGIGVRQGEFGAKNRCATSPPGGLNVTPKVSLRVAKKR